VVLAVHSIDQGHIVEFDQCVDLFASETISINLGIYIGSPATLLADPTSRFHGLCQATGRNEFSMLKNMAGL
jgi:hypothetical protein